MKKIIKSSSIILFSFSLFGCYSLHSDVRYDLVGPQSIESEYNTINETQSDTIPIKDMKPMKLKK